MLTSRLTLFAAGVAEVTTEAPAFMRPIWRVPTRVGCGSPDRNTRKNEQAVEELSPVHSPLPLAAEHQVFAGTCALSRIVGVAVTGHRAVAEHVNHQRVCQQSARIVDTGADAAARTQIAVFADASVAGMIIIAAHGDTAAGGIAVHNHSS